MRSGKKKLIFKKVLKEFENFDSKNNSCKHLNYITELLLSLKPIVETRKVRKAAKNYDVPFFLKEPRQLSLLLRWFVKATRKQGLRQELQNLFLETGTIYSESKALRLKVSNNMKFSHYRWK